MWNEKGTFPAFWMWKISLTTLHDVGGFVLFALEFHTGTSLQVVQLNISIGEL